ncbi:GNAT family N-acetyltransferase [Blastococcus saxobsidens]|uniref:GNAT family N-acetyltransferase n=1 Tax=Blastococcus saxobsidens TaxID=138336 RepID=UPI0031F2E75D
MDVHEVPPETTYALRAAVLRPDGGAITRAGDEHPDTVHLAARLDGAVIGVVRFSPAPCPYRPGSRAPWQLRGMATDPAVRGTGVGRALVEHGLARLADLGADLVWCDARTSAVGFYERTGFRVVGEEFDKPDVGRHVGMLSVVGPRAAGASRSS